MMDINELLSLLRERNVTLSLAGDEVTCDSPVGALDLNLKGLLSSRKEEIKIFLRRAADLKNGPSSIVPIKSQGSRPPLFVVSGYGGTAYFFVALARLLDREQPLLVLQPPGLDGATPLKTVDELARYEVEQIRRYRPTGPYLIAGHCSGGTLAYEVAQQLVAAGESVPLLAMIGSPFPSDFRRGHRIVGHAMALLTGPINERIRYAKSKIQWRVAHYRTSSNEAVDTSTRLARQNVEGATLSAVRDYRPKPYDGPIDLFITAEKWHRSEQWVALGATVRKHYFEEEEETLLMGPSVSLLAKYLQEALDSARFG